MSDDTSSSSSDDDDDETGIIWNRQNISNNNIFFSVPDTNNIPFDKENIVKETISMQAEQQIDDKPKNKKRKRSSDTNIRIYLEPMMDFLCKFARQMKWNTICDKAVSSELIRSKMPEPFKYIDNMKKFNLFVEWFRVEFQIDDDDTLPESHTIESLDKSIQAFRGSRIHANLVFLTMCRHASLPSRLVNTISLQNGTQLTRKTSSSSKKQSKRCFCWTEVLIDMSWCPVVIYEAPSKLAMKFDHTVPYIIALNCCNFPLDVTRRYAERWTKTKQRRKLDPQGWMSIFLLAPLQQRARQLLATNWYHYPENVITRFRSSVSNWSLQEEDGVLESLVFEEIMPKTLEGFKKHPKYILRKQIGVSHCLKRDAPIVGYFKEEPVHLRTDMVEMRSEINWRKHGRIVMEHELESPMRIITPSSKNPETQEEDTEATSDDTPSGLQRRLFAEFQTKVFVPPEIGPDGTIPVSSYGNYELWCPECLPKHASHLTVPMAAEGARAIGIPFAPAMVGFDRRDRRMVPRIEGIIVATQYVILVEEAAEQLQAEKIKELAEKREALITGRWEELTRKLVALQNLKRKHLFDSQTGTMVSCVHIFTTKSRETGPDFTIEVQECSKCGLCQTIQRG